MYFLVQVCYNLVLQKASLTCPRQWGRCTNFFPQLRSIMKASINICNCSQVLGQCLKLFLNCFGCLSCLQRRAGDWDREEDWEANFLSFCTNWTSKLVQTARSFHGATPHRFLLWLNCSIQLSQKNRERLWWKILSIHSNILHRTKTTTQKLQWGEGWMILQIKMNPASADVTLPGLYRNSNYCRPGKWAAVMKG